ncbi:hypothetical protein MKW94_023153 [Papaver nudicaule]|uniref:Peptidase S54 rhomboid domain-containing protein n=1 Tax=Papaver nudicaule TaxID=74823 RepID=A0AA41VU89_PAPNU|nr:hypothetical protein [Papaver nudicaule]
MLFLRNPELVTFVGSFAAPRFICIEFSNCEMSFLHDPELMTFVRSFVAPRSVFSSICIACMISQLELGKPDNKRKPDKNGIFWILLISLGVFAADHSSFMYCVMIHVLILHLVKTDMKLLFSFPVRYQFLTTTFFNHLWSKFFSFCNFRATFSLQNYMWMSYFQLILLLLLGKLVVDVVLARNTVSLGASGAVFGLFSISVSCQGKDSQKILEVLILCQPLTEKFRNSDKTNHIAHLSGSLVGAGLVWLLTRVPSEPSDRCLSKFSDKTNRNLKVGVYECYS